MYVTFCFSFDQYVVTNLGDVDLGDVDQDVVPNLGDVDQGDVD